MTTKLSDADFAWAAKELNVEEAMIRAVAEIEASGSGFLPDGTPKVRFESHWFGKLTGYRYNTSHPTLSTRNWQPRLSKVGVAESARMDAAAKLNRDAALQASSWGLFQIMGFNYRLCGYNSIQEFVNTAYKGERGQLELFVRFLKGRRADRYLREKNFEGFAEVYNGKQFRANGYHTKLRKAYEKWSRLVGK